MEMFEEMDVDSLFKVILFLFLNLATIIGACTTIVSPLKKQIEKAKMEGEEMAKKENAQLNLHGWTGAQQDDIDELAGGNMLAISSLVLVLNRLVESHTCEDGEDYKKVRDILLNYMSERGTQNRSHK